MVKSVFILFQIQWDKFLPILFIGTCKTKQNRIYNKKQLSGCYSFFLRADMKRDFSLLYIIYYIPLFHGGARNYLRVFLCIPMKGMILKSKCKLDL